MPLRGLDQLAEGRLHGLACRLIGLVVGASRGQRQAPKQGHQGHDGLHAGSSCKSITGGIRT